MTEMEARQILQAYRPDATEPDDPQFAEALALAAANPELTRWLEAEQQFDRAIASHLAAVPTPFGLKTRILAQAPAAPVSWWRSLWPAPLVAAVVLAVVLLQVTGLWHTSPATSAGAAPEFAREMVSFVQLPPTLEMKSDDLGAIKHWLAQKEAHPVQVPARLSALAPLGCRVLSFRGHDVTLICFQRDGNRLAHLFTVARGALPKIHLGAKPVFENENGWMTATWAEQDRVYMIAMQGSRAALEPYLPDA